MVYIFFKVYIFILLICLCQILVVACRIICSMWELVPCPGIEPRSPALGVGRLSHWTTRRVLIVYVL